MVSPVWKGRLGYDEAWQAQRAHREALRAGRVGEELWLLEHDPVVTTGRRPVPGLDADLLARQGYELRRTERGGLATCHEPGQLVGYLLCDARDLGVRRLVGALEAGIIDWLATRGVDAHRREGLPGVWVGDGKICAIGLHVSGGLTMHGFALNLVNDLRGFSWIVPCGIPGGRVVALVSLDPTAPRPEDAAAAVGAAVTRALLDVRAALA